MEKTLAKKLLITGALAYGGYLLFNTSKSLLSDVDVKIAGFGVPQFTAGVLSVPVQVAITNPSSINIPVSDLRIDLYVQQQNRWIKAGATTPTGAFIISSGRSMQMLTPNIPVSVFGSTLLQAIANVATLKPVIKAVAFINVKGIEVTHQREINL